ncbi:MAG: hypothetical protein P8018_08810 [Acidobacteriota bacterium]
MMGQHLVQRRLVDGIFQVLRSPVDLQGVVPVLLAFVYAAMHDDGDVFRPGGLHHLLAYLESVLLRQHRPKQDQIRFELSETFERGYAVPCFFHLVIAVRQHLYETVEGFGLVIND